MAKVLTVATRAGRLALAQTSLVVSQLTKKHHDLQVSVKKITTAGDRDRSTALWSLKDSGFFTSQIESALLTRRVDFAVHSFKDLPTRPASPLAIAAVCDRCFVEDCLVAKVPVDSIESLPSAARVGTSSLRRAAQLKHLRPDLRPVPARGNVLTRIRLLDADRVDALILARAGLERLGLRDRISFCFDPTVLLPAPAQGALAVQARSDEPDTLAILAAIDDPTARLLASAERQILVTMRCGCHAPVGAFAKTTAAGVEITAFVSDLAGNSLVIRSTAGPLRDALALAENLAHQLLDAGGQRILQNLQGPNPTPPARMPPIHDNS